MDIAVSSAGSIKRKKKLHHTTQALYTSSHKLFKGCPSKRERERERSTVRPSVTLKERTVEE